MKIGRNWKPSDATSHRRWISVARVSYFPRSATVTMGVATLLGALLGSRGMAQPAAATQPQTARRSAPDASHGRNGLRHDLDRESIELAVRSEEERRGDYDALSEQWLQRLSQTNDVSAELIAMRLSEVHRFLREPTATLTSAEKALGNDRLDGWTRHALENYAIRLYERAGAFDRAASLAAGQGFLRHWQLIGPFAKGRSILLDEPFPPESIFDPGATYDAGWQKLTWRSLTLPAQAPTVRPAARSFPSNGVFYAATHVRAAQAVEVIVVRTSALDLRLWIDGELIADDNVNAAFLPRRRLTRVTLHPGTHRILVKALGSFSVRLTDGDGAAIDNSLLAAEEAGAPAGTALAGLATAPQPVSLLGRWQADSKTASDAQPPADEAAAATETTSAGDAQIAFALAALKESRYDLAVEAADLAIAAQPDDPATLYHAASVYRYSRYLPSTVAKNRAESAFKKCLEVDPQFIPAYERVARYLEQDKNFGPAAETMKSGLALAPSFLRGLLRLKTTYAQASWREEEIETVRQIEAVAPHHPSAPLFWGAYYRELNNLQAAQQHLARALDIHPARTATLSSLASLARSAGDIDAAEGYLRRRLEIRPASVEAAEELATFLARQERYDEALEATSTLAELEPQEPKHARRRGMLLEAQNRIEEAQDAYRHALRLEPGAIELARYLGETQPAGDRFWDEKDENLDDWLPRIPESGPLVEEANALAILDISITRLERDGSSSEYVHQAFKVLSEEAKKELAEIETPGEVVLLRTIAPDGEILEPVPALGKSAYVMPGVVPGAIVEFAYRVDRAHQQGRPLDMRRFYFQDPSMRQAFLLSRYVIQIAPGVDVSFDERQLSSKDDGEALLANVSKDVAEAADGSRVVTYEAANVPRLQPERMQPASSELIPNVAIKSKRTWGHVAAALTRSNEGSSRATSELRELARELVADHSTATGKARAIYDYVRQEIPAAQGGNTAAAVFFERAGDRDALLKALYDLAGVACDWAFLRQNEATMAATNWSLPSENFFQHRMLAVDLDDGEGTHFVSLRSSRSLPFGFVPRGFHGGKALVLTPGAQRIVAIAASNPTSSSNSTHVFVQLTDGVDGDVTLEMNLRDAANRANKDRLKPAPAFQKKVVLQRLVSGLFPGAQVDSASFEGLDDIEAPMQIRARLTAPKILRPVDDKFTFRPFVRPSSLVRTFGDKGDRRLPCHFRSSGVVVRDEVRVKLSPVYRVDQLPRHVVLLSALGDYSLTVRQSADEIHLERSMNLSPGRLAAHEYAEFLEFCRQVDLSGAENIVLRQRTPNAESGD